MRVCPPLVSEREVARLRIRLRSSLKRTRVSRRRSCANQSSAFARTVFGTFGKQFAKRQLPLAERRTRVSVAPMRPAITAFNPSRCVVTCKALPAPHPVKQHKFLRHQPKNSRPQIQRCCATPEDKQSTEEDEDFEGLLPEEDWTVPGGYQDSLSSNTELGRAVQNACDELDNLSNLEKESLTKASELLQKLGYKGSIFQDAPASTKSGESKQPEDDA